MSPLPLGILAGQISGPGFSGFAFGGSQNDDATRVAVDSSGNIFLAGNTRSVGPGNNSVILFKLSPDFNVIWQKTFGDANNNFFQDIKISTVGEIFFSFHDFTNLYLVRIDTNGNVVHQKSFRFNGHNNQYPQIWINPPIPDLGKEAKPHLAWQFVVTQFPSDGTAGYARFNRTCDFEGGAYRNKTTAEEGASTLLNDYNGWFWLSSTTSSDPRAASVRSIEFMRFGADYTTRSGGGVIANYRSAGDNVDRQAINLATFMPHAYANNALSPFMSANGTFINNWAFLGTKHASDASIQWMKALGGSSLETFPHYGEADNDENLYIVGATNDTYRRGQIAKWDTNGNLLWQRRINMGTADTRIYGMALDGNDIIVCGFTASNIVPGGSTGNNGWVLRLPADGSGVSAGKSNNLDIVYEASSLTVNNGTANSISATGNSTSPATTSGTTSYTMANSAISTALIPN